MSYGIVTLAYDGTQTCHLETAIPHLNLYGFKGTFFAEPSNLLDAYPGWLHAQSNGHEIGNGSLLAAALPDGSLPAWTTDMILDDLSEANDLLHELFPNQKSFPVGLPLGKSICADCANYQPLLKFSYPLIRSGNIGINATGKADCSNLATFDPNDLDGPELCQIARQAAQSTGWLIFSFDGIGSGQRSIDAAAHKELLEYLSQNIDLIEVLPLSEAATRINSRGHAPHLI